MQEHQSLVCWRLCSPWRVHECVNCATFTHALNAEQPDDNTVLVNPTLLVCISVVIYTNDCGLAISFVNVIRHCAKSFCSLVGVQISVLVENNARLVFVLSKTLAVKNAATFARWSLYLANMQTHCHISVVDHIRKSMWPKWLWCSTKSSTVQT